MNKAALYPPNNRKAYLHLIAWLAYALFLFVANKLTNPNTSFLKICFLLIPYCSTFYLSVFFLDIFKSRGIIWQVVSFLMVFLVMAIIAYWYIYLILPIFHINVFTTTDLIIFIQKAILGYVQHFAYAVLYFNFSEILRKERQLRTLKEENLMIAQEKIQKDLENAILKQQELKSQKEKIQYEYAFLRAQINPHFLHNTLNVLFSQALDYSNELADNILKLSKIMRYSLESLEYESGTVSVQKELENLQTLLEINTMRFGDSKTIAYSLEGEVSGQLIPPLSIMTIVENAFKYGDLKDPQNPLQIKIILKPNEIYFFCKNKKKKNTIQLSSSSIGISNLSKRLDVVFKGKYEMKPVDEIDFYSLELIIKN
jgi:sensor histidine kinase YesM